MIDILNKKIEKDNCGANRLDLPTQSGGGRTHTAWRRSRADLVAPDKIERKRVKAHN